MAVCQKAMWGYTLPVLKCGSSQGADITVDILLFISSCGEVLAEGTTVQRQPILHINIASSVPVKGKLAWTRAVWLSFPCQFSGIPLHQITAPFPRSIAWLVSPSDK
jgi:hypothetical protein